MSDQHLDLHPLLPESQLHVSVLSRLRRGRFIAAHHDRQRESWMLTAMDISFFHSVSWSRPVRDLSGQPRPTFDDDGHRIDEPPSTELEELTVYHLVHHADGRYAALVGHEKGVDLYGFEADGSFRFRTVLIPVWPSDPLRPTVVERDDGSLTISLSLQPRQRPAFEALHGVALGEPPTIAPDAPPANLPVLVSISAAGEITSIHDAVGANAPTNPPVYPALLRGTLTLVDERLSWFLVGVREHLMLTLSPGERVARVFRTPFRFPYDHPDSMAAVAGDLYVAGRIGGSTINVKGGVRPGPAFLGRMAPDGALAWRCIRHTADASPAESVNAQEATYELHPTEVPLLSVRTPFSAPRGLAQESEELRVYLLSRVVAQR